MSERLMEMDGSILILWRDAASYTTDQTAQKAIYFLFMFE